MPMQNYFGDISLATAVVGHKRVQCHPIRSDSIAALHRSSIEAHFLVPFQWTDQTVDFAPTLRSTPCSAVGFVCSVALPVPRIHHHLLPVSSARRLGHSTYSTVCAVQKTPKQRDITLFTASTAHIHRIFPPAWLPFPGACVRNPSSPTFCSRAPLPHHAHIAGHISPSIPPASLLLAR